MGKADADYAPVRKRGPVVDPRDCEDAEGVTKPSGATGVSKVAWTHPATWPVRKLGSFCSKIGSGATPFGGKEVYLNTRTSHALIRSQHVFDRHFDFSGLAFISEGHSQQLQNAEVRSGDILLNITGDGITFARACLAPDSALPACVNQHVSIIRVDPNVCDPGYLLSFLTHPLAKRYMESFNTGGSRRAITKGHIESFEIPLPPLGIQRRIAGILLAYDKLIENNQRRIRILEEITLALYREWFVVFHFPGHEKAKFVSSPLGDIPKSWEAKPVPECIHLNPRIPVPRDGEKPFVPMASLSNDSMLISDIESRSGNSGAKFQNSDTLFARITPCLENGKTAFVQFLDDPQAVAFGSTEFIVLRSRTLTPEFVYCVARSDEFRNIAIKSMGGATGRQRVQEKCFDTFLIAEPPHDLLIRFTDIVAPSFRLIHGLHRQIQNLRQTRDLLLPRLLSGEVQVAEVEKSTEKIISFPDQPYEKSTKKASDEFVEAVVIAQLARKLGTTQFPLGRLRYNKLAYLAHRKAEDDVTQQVPRHFQWN